MTTAPARAWFVAVGTVLPFALLTALVAGRWAPLLRLDGAVAGLLHAWAVGHPAAVRAMVVWSLVFAPNVLRAAALALVIWLYRRHRPGPAWWVVATMATGGVLEGLLKLLVGRHRPDFADPVARASGYAFPSGHAITVTLAAGVVVILAGRRRPAVWIAALAVVVITGFCRLALGVHWTSDVVGGWLLGVAVVAATRAVWAPRARPSAYAASAA
jgi:membrane-associated phospholipid phosphatase